MKLQQLRYVLEVARNNLNISDAAEVLYTSQPGISKQIKQLEEELGLPIFIRSGKRIVAISEVGQEVVRLSEQIIQQMQNLKKIGSDFAHVNTGTLKIAMSQVTARYVLPEVILKFQKIYPKVNLVIKQGELDEIEQMLSQSEVDFAIGARLVPTKEIAVLSCYETHQDLIVLPHHDLANQDEKLTLEEIKNYPLISHDFGDLPNVANAFLQHRLDPYNVLAVTDNDAIKAYVRLGLGVGLIENISYSSDVDGDLVRLDGSALFDSTTTSIAIKKDSYLKGYAYTFIALFNPRLTRSVVDDALYAITDSYVDDYMI